MEDKKDNYSNNELEPLLNQYSDADSTSFELYIMPNNSIESEEEEDEDEDEEEDEEEDQEESEPVIVSEFPNVEEESEPVIVSEFPNVEEESEPVIVNELPDIEFVMSKVEYVEPVYPEHFYVKKIGVKIHVGFVAVLIQSICYVFILMKIHIITPKVTWILRANYVTWSHISTMDT